jgi:U3 small nucleolar RNA-associated protein 7
MKHKAAGAISSVKFLPYEDVLAVGHSQGYSSLVIPGSGEANFDAFEANPFQTKKQTQEALVHGLLEKLPIESISLKIKEVGKVDTATAEVKAQEAREEEEQRMAELRLKDKKRVKKMRGKMKTGRVEGSKVRQQHEAIREKNKLALVRDLKKAQEHERTMTADLEFLSKVEGKFDPFHAAVSG